jgi:adenylosuccinate lyase
VPGDALEAIRAHAAVDVARIRELEQTTDHEVVAFVNQLAERIGPEGRFLHLGLTSSDVLDTALALQLGAAGERLGADLDALIAVVVERAREHAATVVMGRTHSVHAEPTTLGLKLASWAFELDRARGRLAGAFKETAAGKLSGPVGTYSHLDPELEAEVLERLGLSVEPAATQVVARDRHAAVLAAIAVAGGTLERIATEVRNLQHTEIGELAEPFRAGQAGSSAMPHKRNPIVAERIAGLARLLRGYAQAGFEDQALWHERDISHSSVERVALPDAMILLDYMLVKTALLVEGMTVNAARMRQNIERGLGLWASSRLLLALVESGMEREAAYRIVQRAALKAADEERPFRSVAEDDLEITSRVTGEALAASFDEAHLLRNVDAVIARLERLTEPARVRG